MVRSIAASILMMSTLFCSTARADEAGRTSHDLVAVSVGPDSVRWSPRLGLGEIALTLADPTGAVHSYRFAAGASPVLTLVDDAGIPLPDGVFTWEVRFSPRDAGELAAQVEEAVAAGDLVRARDLERALAPAVEAGYVVVEGGLVVAQDLVESSSEALDRPGRQRAAPQDQMVTDDLIVDGKGCIGLGCANNESFGQETLRLKQSVVRLKFQDTSAQVGFASEDWQLVANDAGSGGVDRFSLDDVTAGTTPMTFMAGAPSHALYVDATGKVGLGTATPSKALHLKAATAPTLRLDQSGGVPYIWDLAATQTAFSIQDVTGGSPTPLTPFTVSAGAPSSALFIDPAGKVGLGTASPATTLHLSAGNSPAVRLAQTGGTPQVWDLVGNSTSFAVQDVTGSSARPLAVQAGAPTDALVVAVSGLVGLGTGSPATTLHLASGSPALRFEKTGGTARTWDLIGAGTTFSLQDITGSSATPFVVTAGAPTNALLIDASGRVGLGTNAPGKGFHLAGATPTLRLEQTGGTPRVWDLVASGSSFAVQDITGSSAIPFVVTAGAPTNAVVIDATGRVGLGTNAPGTGLHLASSSPTLRLEQTGGTPRVWDVVANATSFAVQDITGASAVPLRLAAGAPTDSLAVDAAGNVGLGTASPLRDLHVKSSAPGFRLEQTGGSPRSWDLLASDTSFSLTDATSSTTPFRVAAAAPTSSIEVLASGRVGMGIATPSDRLHVRDDSNANSLIVIENAGTGLSAAGVLRAKSNAATVNFQAHGSGRTISRFGVPLASWAEFLQVTGNGLIVGTSAGNPLILGTNSTDRIHITADGKVGIGVAGPTHLIELYGGAYSNGSTWEPASSRTLKHDIHALDGPLAMNTLGSLEPVTFRYNANPDEAKLGFIAEDVPELVASTGRKSVDPMNIIALLTKVVQEQERRIEMLERELSGSRAENQR